MSLLDLSVFRQNYVRDTVEDMQEIAAMKQTSMIQAGSHEVVVVGIHEKDGIKLKLVDKLGGSLGFSLVVRNSQKQEQMIYFIVPIALTFIQACKSDDKGCKFLFTKANKSLQTMGLDLIALRESLISTDGASIDLLIGTQFVIHNSWNPMALHLEYDATTKAQFFVDGMGRRFPDGELSLPHQIDKTVPLAERFNDFIAIAHAHQYQFASQMDTTIESHPTANNLAINEALYKASKPKESHKELKIVNKTIPAFPVLKTKTIIASPDIEPDIEW